MKKTTSILLVLFIALGLVDTQTCLAIEKPGEVLEQDVGIFTQLGSKIDLSLQFTNQDGVSGKLSDFVMPGKPIIIAPVYYKCPRLCGLVMDGAITLFNELALKAGRDFSFVAISFNPIETTDLALKEADRYIKRLVPESPNYKQGWIFLTGQKDSISPIMSQLGFRYLPDGEDFAHSSAIMVLTADGTVSQYFTGIEFPAWDVRLALVEASKGVVGSAIDHLLLFCFRFDPLQGKYTWAVLKMLKLCGTLTLLGLAVFYFFFVMRKPRHAKSEAQALSS